MNGNPFLDGVAAELDLMHGELERIGAELCSDPALVARHIAILQRIDEIGQRHHHLAELLRAGDPVEAIDRIGLDSLADRLRQTAAGQIDAPRPVPL